MTPLESYLRELRDTRATGEAVKETSYYPALSNLFNEIGKELDPRVRAVINIKNRGAGVPDGGLFTAKQLKAFDDDVSDALAAGHQPERGVIEVKGASEDVRAIAASEQVNRYLKHYGQVLVINLREFLLVTKDESGAVRLGESYALAGSEREFWEKIKNPKRAAGDDEARFVEYLKRVMLSNAPLDAPETLAWFLASYARDAKARIERAELPPLAAVREGLEQALGLRFEGAQGERFFRSTLVQTLFYGVFSAWVLWSKSPEGRNKANRFDWRVAQWTLHVPVIRTLFEQVVTPSNVRGLGLEEVLRWTSDALNRVRREEFFKRFEESQAVQYFYEPFLEAFDPELRKSLGVWYTPNEIVRYMVERADRVLREELEIENGLADENVYVLDPCCGTGAYLVEVLRRIKRTLDEAGGDALMSNDLKRAAMTRVFGFEILPAPFVIAHLQLGLLLQTEGISLAEGERVGVYLTNALTGWTPPVEPKTRLLFPELEQERDAAEAVKQRKRILVIIGNPPYNAFAGTSAAEEGGLVEIYKQGLVKEWGIKKFNLDDLYVRFFRLAERRIAEMTGEGVVCFISNFSYLSDPSFVVMRRRFAGEFDRLWFDSMNGDSRETGKLTPEGKPDPSVFSTERNREGIRVGTAIGLMVRKKERDEQPTIRFRQFWGVTKRQDLLRSLEVGDDANKVADANKISHANKIDDANKINDANKNVGAGLVPARVVLIERRAGTSPAPTNDFNARYETANPTATNRYSFRPSDVTAHYLAWAALTEIAMRKPFAGLSEDRRKSLIGIEREVIEHRMKMYFDSSVTWEELASLNTCLTTDVPRFNAKKAREILTKTETFDESRMMKYAMRPFDVQWCYYSPVRPLWREPRPDYWESYQVGTPALVSRFKAAKSPEGAPIAFARQLCDYHMMPPNAFIFPFMLKATSEKKEKNRNQDSLLEQSAPATRANLSTRARAYLSTLGISDVDTNFDSAALVWHHALAIGYAPAYLEGNRDGIYSDFPRVPLPATRGLLEASAALGKQIAGLLDTEREVAGVTSGAIRPELRPIARITRTGGGALQPEAGELELRAGWGHRGKAGVVMPGKGRTRRRTLTGEEIENLKSQISDEAARNDEATTRRLERFGAETLDVFLNDAAHWSNVPARVWEYTIGGYQVIKKWLSYREFEILNRSLTTDEAREVTNIARRIAAILLLEVELDANYERVEAAAFEWRSPPGE